MSINMRNFVKDNLKKKKEAKDRLNKTCLQKVALIEYKLGYP